MGFLVVIRSREDIEKLNHNGIKTPTVKTYLDYYVPFSMTDGDCFTIYYENIEMMGFCNLFWYLYREPYNRSKLYSVEEFIDEVLSLYCYFSLEDL